MGDKHADGARRLELYLFLSGIHLYKKLMSTRTGGCCRFLLALALTQAPGLLCGSAVPQSTGPAGGVVVDRIVASVNGQAITQSDVEDAIWMERFSASLNSASPATLASQPISQSDYESELQRLIDQRLLAGAMHIKGASLDGEQQLATLRQRCGGEDKLEARAAEFHLTEAVIRGFLGEQLAILAALDRRFEAATAVSDDDVKHYYYNVFLPEAGARHITAAPLAEVRPQIREILAQQQLSQIERAWLETLRRTANIQLRK